MRKFALLLMLIVAGSAAAQTTPGYSWLTGTWTGPGFGGTMEETWSAPDQHGIMIGMFRHLDETGQPTFYEFWSLTREGLRLRHFHPDMRGWEEQEGFMNFKMINASENRLELHGLIYEKTDAQHVKISLDLEEDGQVHTEVFVLTRQE